MTKKKDHLIGIRFTKEERQLIENFARERNCTITEFIRESIFSHINHLDVDDFLINFNNIEKSAEIVLKSIAILKKRLDIYDFERLKFNSTKQLTSSEEVKDF
jgi:predicted DNA-binding protein